MAKAQYMRRPVLMEPLLDFRARETELGEETLRIQGGVSE